MPNTYRGGYPNRSYAIDTDAVGHNNQTWGLYRKSDDALLFASHDIREVQAKAKELGISEDDIDEYRI